METTMQEFAQLLNELGSIGSTNAKKEILGKYTSPAVKEYLQHALDPFRMYNITSKHISLKPGPLDLDWESAKSNLMKLFRREITGHAAIDMVNTFLMEGKPEQQQAYLKILDKDLDCGTGATLVNNVYEDLIPSFDVMLCKPYEDLEKVPFSRCFCSRKLDGVRVIAIKQGNDPFKFHSREGKEFTSLAKLGAALDEHFKNVNDIVLDGELCIVDEHGNENFIEAVSQIKRKSHTMENPKYILFDVLPLAHFYKKFSPKPASQRYQDLMEMMGTPTQYWMVLKQVPVINPEHLQMMMNAATEFNWEGLILKNMDSPYEGKRTKNCLKVKKFHDAEFKITGVEEGEGKYQGMLGALHIEGEVEHKSFGKLQIKSKVGSGYNDKDRQEMWAIREQLPGLIATIQYFEISKDKEGNNSLRFPIYKILHGKERTT